MVNSEESKIVSAVAVALSHLGVTQDSSVLLAVSGGVDSMSLAWILDLLRSRGHLKRLTLFHVNHSLRGRASNGDEALVRKFAKKHSLSLVCVQVDTRAFAAKKKIGIEEAARDLRYANIEKVVQSGKYEFVLTAHNANDQAETVLMNLVRGSGIGGMKGIPESRKLSKAVTLIRPLLTVSKSDIRAFAEEHKLQFREDASNDSLYFKRNRVRHLVIPALEKAFEDRDVFAGFTKMTQNISSVAGYMEKEIDILKMRSLITAPSFFTSRRVVSFLRTSLLEAPDFIRRELIIQVTSELLGRPISLDQVHSVLLESFLHFPSAKAFSLAPEVIIFHDGANLSIERTEPAPSDTHLLGTGEKTETPIGIVSASKKKEWTKPRDADTAYFSFEALRGRKLLIRYWKPGDRMKPFGMKGKSRLVSDILSDAGIKTERLKYFVPLVVFNDEPDQILWVPGIRSAEFGRLSSKSETALELKRIITSKGK